MVRAKNELKSFWNNYFKFNWKFGLLLLLIVCVPRFILVLNANKTGNYGFIGIIMLISALVPFIFLSKFGRGQIGLKITKKLRFLVLALVAGIAFSFLLYLIGEGLYGNSYRNWYEYIGKSYNIPEIISAQDKRAMFIIVAITSMVFSPVGEELFFRGIVHGSFANSIGDKKASVIDSLAFAITHIAHFGMVFINDRWDFYVVPALFWVVSMFTVSVVFFIMKKRSGSLLGAIICHSGFNLGMVYCIFYLL